ncbi:nitrous oxide reductase family maturation protein NosD [Vibrio sp.]|uniref:nitrous oxide reductase family maturation protein NosD n=1 Tax=Vibrio sp. TaxID=678 RepID=UPI003D0FCEE6
MKKLPWLSLAFSVLFHQAAFAATISVNPSDDLQAALNSASAGDTIVLLPGRYVGNFTIPTAMTLSGEQGAVIDAQGKDNALTLTSSDVTVEGLQIINWGKNLTEQNAGIYSDQPAENLVIRRNQLKGNGFGMWIQRANRITIEHNLVEGNTELRSADRGNGIQLSTVTHAVVSDNEVFHTRDGLYVISSQHSLLRNNTMHDLRYGVHYMYSHSNKVIGNLAYNTRAGYALMSSKNLSVQANISRDTEDYGMLMNFITQSDISYNQFYRVWTKPENKVIGREGKGLFVYNSGQNTISYNRIDTAEIGIHLTAGSEDVKVYGNAFINNPVQVKYVSSREQEWSQESVGNYWSNYLGWDLDNDQIGDTPFEPNDGIDKMMWKYPESKVLLDSPAVLMLRWIQKQFPVLKPVGVKDSYPLMSPLDLDSIVEQIKHRAAVSQPEGNHS